MRVMDWLTSFSAFIVSVIVGLTNVGGGSLMTPLSMLVIGDSPATAVGTDLLHAAIAEAADIYVHDRDGMTNLTLASAGCSAWVVRRWRL